MAHTASQALLFAGVQLIKMTPIRAVVVMHSVAVASVVGRSLGMEVEHVYSGVRLIPAVMVDQRI